MRSTRWWTSLPLVFLYMLSKALGGIPRVLHRNLLLALQGRIRQEDRVGEEGSSDSEDEDGDT